MKQKSWIIILLILALCNAVLYFPTQFFFLNDDFIHLALTDEGVFFQHRSIRPIHELLVKFNLLVFGKHAYGFHVTSLILHFVVCIQLFFVSNSILIKQFNTNANNAKQTSFLAVALFLIYPQYTESLTWIIGGAPILAGIFLLLSLQIYYQEKLNLIHRLIGFLFFLISLFTYEQSILFPIFLCLLLIGKSKENYFNKRLKYALILLFAGIVYIISRKIITTEIVGNYEGENFNNSHISVLVGNVVRLFFRLFLNPSSVYLFVLGIVVVMLFTSIIFWRLKKRIAIDQFLFFIVIIVLLMIPVFSLGISVQSFESGRYLYLPSIFLVMLLSKFFVEVYYTSIISPKWLLIIFSCFCLYWMNGKIRGAKNYQSASDYVKNTHKAVREHFNVTNDTFYIDSLHLTIHKIPVFRKGFKRGIQWLHPTIDTNKIVVNHFDDGILLKKN